MSSRAVPSLLLLFACQQPLESDASFRVQGTLKDEAGNLAADTTVYVAKVDAFTFDSDVFLNFVSTPTDVPGVKALYSATTDASGAFVLELTGTQVNTTGGDYAAYLAVVYYDKGDKTSYLATMTDWYVFSDANPTWDAGTLILWDGGAASQQDAVLAFDWSATPAPTGNSPDSSRPTFLYGYQSGDTTVQWAEHTTATVANVPRSAFGNGVPPDWFLTTASQQAAGGTRYFHRTALRTGDASITDWIAQPTGNNNNYLRESFGAALYNGAGQPVGGEATDGSLTTVYSFAGLDTVDRQAFFVDLGDVRSFRDVLAYNVAVASLSNAQIALALCPEDGDTPPTPASVCTTLQTWEGAGGFQDWVYLGYTGTGSGRWLRFSVQAQATGNNPYFVSLAEVAVKYGE